MQREEQGVVLLDEVDSSTMKELFEMHPFLKQMTDRAADTMHSHIGYDGVWFAPCALCAEQANVELEQKYKDAVTALVNLLATAPIGHPMGDAALKALEAMKESDPYIFNIVLGTKADDRDVLG